ncbi:hypothetical protein RKD52_003084 [Metabacillus sp. SLBN-84]
MTLWGVGQKRSSIYVESGITRGNGAKKGASNLMKVASLR